MLQVDLDASVGTLGVETTEYRGHTPEEWACMAANKIVYVCLYGCVCLRVFYVCMLYVVYQSICDILRLGVLNPMTRQNPPHLVRE